MPGGSKPNARRAVAAEHLQQLADGLTPVDLEVPIQCWLRQLVPFYASADPNRISEYVYRLFDSQVEYCTNLVFGQRAARRSNGRALARPQSQ